MYCKQKLKLCSWGKKYYPNVIGYNIMYNTKYVYVMRE